MEKIICRNEECQVMYNKETYKDCPMCKTIPTRRIIVGTKEDPIETDVKIFVRRKSNDKY